MVLFLFWGVGGARTHLRALKKYDLTIPGYLNKNQLQRDTLFSNVTIELQHYSLPWRSDNHRDNRHMYSAWFKTQGYTAASSVPFPLLLTEHFYHLRFRKASSRH